MANDTLTITDNRTGKSYEIPIQYGINPLKSAYIRAGDLRQIKTSDEDFGLLSYDPAFVNTASSKSGITEIDGATTLVHQAAWARDAGRSIEKLAPMAKLFATEVFRKMSATAIQIHGGMGFTVDCDAQLYFRRAKQLQISWWDTRYLEELVAHCVLDTDR